MHRSNWRRLAVLCLFCLSIHALAVKPPPVLPGHPHYSIQHFGEHFGLGSATILSLAQDSQGFLWIGTETGLFRYDGNGVTRFGRADGLPGESVDLVLAAPDGNLWVRTRKGIARRLRERFEAIDLPAAAGAPRDTYQSFAVDQHGTVFVSAQHGLLRLEPDNNHYDLFRIGTNAVKSEVSAVARAEDDTIWFSSGKDIERFRPGISTPETFAAVDLGGEEHDERVVALLPSPGGKLWIRTTSRLGFIRIDGGPTKPSWLHENLPSANNQGGPSLDQRGNLLLPTAQGLYWRDEDGDSRNGWRVIDHRSGLTSSAVASALEDREGGIWIGTTGTGLDYWPGSKQWSGWTDAEGLPDALVLGVVRDHRGRLWVAANTAVCYWDPQTSHWQTVTQAGAHGGARQIKLASDGAVWTIVPGKGIYRFDANLEHPVAQAVPLPPDWRPQSIASAPDNSIWADGKDLLHLIRYDHDRGHFSVTELSAPAANQGTTQSVSVGPGGVVWSAGANGVSRYDHGRWQHFGKEAGLLSDDVIEIEAVRDGEAWLRYQDEGQSSRLRSRADGGVDVMQVAQGVCSLGIDQHDHVWTAMDVGAAMISPDGKQRVFTEEDGLIWNDLNCGSLWQDSDGGILLGTSKGLARYDESQDQLASRQPSIVLTSAVFGKEDHDKEDHGKQDRLLESAPQIKYEDATLLARFASPVFHHGRDLTCRYRLGGLEKDFTETKLREVRYSSLSAGNYTFEVSCGCSQLGQGALAAYSFTVLPPWWQTWWAKSSGAVAFALLLWVTIYSRQCRHRREKQRLELAVAERSAALAQANNELQEASLCDPLTGVRNRRFFQSMIAADASQAVRAYRGGPIYQRGHRDLVFFLVDIDHFKEVNDHFGHDAGDRVLIQIARRLAGVVRGSDFLIRWGGEEFLVVCRSAERSDATHMASRILDSISGTEFDLGNERTLTRSCSVGWAAFPWLPQACSSLSVDEVLRLADRGLYLAKQNGRNQAVGVVPTTEAPTINAQTGPDQYRCVEQLIEADLIREVRTPGEKAAGAGV